MASASKLVAAVRTSRVTEKRLWCKRLYCGRIVTVKQDGTLVLCVRKYGHPASECFNPESRKRKTRRAA